MKQIFCLRHAEALSGYGSSDIERRLSPKGEEDAMTLGAEMVERGYRPDLIYCSPAVRTRMTLDKICAAFDAPIETVFVDGLYNGGIDAYMDVLQNTDGAINAAMIIGHNPSIHGTAARLAADDNSADVSAVMSRYRPCTLSVFQFAGADWAAVQPYENALIAFMEADQ